MVSQRQLRQGVEASASERGARSAGRGRVAVARCVPGALVVDLLAGQVWQGRCMGGTSNSFGMLEGMVSRSWRVPKHHLSSLDMM